MAPNQPRQWRKNVLMLVGFGYATVVIIFIGVACSTATVAQAADIVQGPLLALIGGSLAISKDLVQLDKEEESAVKTPPDDGTK